MVPFEIGEAFVLFVVALSYVPVVRAYAVEGANPLAVAAHTALLVGRVAAVLEPVYGGGLLPLVEHGVGVALAAALFAGFCYRQWRTGDRWASSRGSHSPFDGGGE